MHVAHCCLATPNGVVRIALLALSLSSYPNPCRTRLRLRRAHSLCMPCFQPTSQLPSGASSTSCRRIDSSTPLGHSIKSVVLHVRIFLRYAAACNTQLTSKPFPRQRSGSTRIVAREPQALALSSQLDFLSDWVSNES